jgi:hypothetical protein
MERNKKILNGSPNVREGGEVLGLVIVAGEITEVDLDGLTQEKVRVRGGRAQLERRISSGVYVSHFFLHTAKKQKLDEMRGDSRKIMKKVELKVK